MLVALGCQLFLPQNDKFLWGLLVGSALGWTASCGLDIYIAYKLIRFRRFERNVPLDRIPYLMWVKDQSNPTPRSLKNSR